MTILHTVNKSPFEKTTLESCLRHAKPGDAILLIEDGVIAAMKGTAMSERIAARNAGLSLYALGPDLAARGITGTLMNETIKVVDYSGFVDLVAEYDVTQAWL